MRRLLVAIGLSLLLLPASSRAASSLFDLFYDEARQAQPSSMPSKRITDFVIAEMKTWNDEGIMIDENDIAAAIKGDLTTLCGDKLNAAGQRIDIGFNDTPQGSGCNGIQSTILSLIKRERETEELGTDLLTIANGSELAVADEPGRPVSMSQLASLLRKVWSGTGMVAIPWNGDATPAFKALDTALASEQDLDAVVLRFQHGYFRDAREQDPRFATIGTGIADKLKDLAEKLAIKGDPTAIGEFATLPLTVPNVRLWTRKDDLGLMWQYPSHFARVKIEEAKEYPTKREMTGSAADALAYPFSYGGSEVPAAKVVSPLCSRTVGRSGYLCRPLPATSPSCKPSQAPDAKAITLVKCGETSGTVSDGPRICPDFKALYQDTGESLLTEDGKPNTDALEPADPSTICWPGTQVLYGNDIPSNACYVGLCVLESLKGHTLIPGRNSVLTGEQSAPYAACIRPDPQLGTSMEVATNSPYPLPQYMGPSLVREFDREYCLRSGDPPLGLASFCSFDVTSRVQSPDASQAALGLLAARDAASVTNDQSLLLAAASAIGERAALDQTIETERKVFAAVTGFVSEMNDLFSSLSRALLTQTPCPWTGPFRSNP